ncbi:hypothetical protein MMC12_001278 [Toensbergia leucococca]|nr:hypothetical protein [Toensbergia leucococca]
MPLSKALRPPSVSLVRASPALRGSSKTYILSSSKLFRASLATKPPRGLRKTVSRPLYSSQQGPQKQPESPPQPQEDQPSSPKSVSDALRDTNTQENNLLSPVYIPEDPNGLLNERHPAASILSNSAIVVQRQLELMNVMLGFEQANKYLILNPQGEHIGYIAERDLGMGNMMTRQMFRTHRSFVSHVFDKNEKEVLRIHRPFSWISSRIRIYNPLEVANGSYSSSTALQGTTPGSLSSEINQTSAQISPLALEDMRVIGEAQQQWRPLRRQYNLFLYREPPNPETDLGTQRIASGDLPLSDSQQLQVSKASKDNGEAQYGQFAFVDEPFLSWDFSLRSADDRLIGSVNRNFAGFGREIFTDTGIYALRMDAAGLAEEPRHLISKTGEASQTAYDDPKMGMTLDQRAVMLATAVSIDFDYFSRKSGSGGGAFGFMPLWFPGGGEVAGGAAAGEAGAGAVGGEGAAGAVGRATQGAGVGEGAVAGAGTMAGYEAMQRGAYGDDASPTAGQSDSSGFGAGQAPPERGPLEPGEEVWGEGTESWTGGQGGGSGDSGGGDGGGSDWGSWLQDMLGGDD